MQSERNNDYHRIITFSNGYGASVICNEYSLGGRQGLFEVGVLDKDGNLCYDTPITNDVIGNLTFEAVSQILTMISCLDSVVEVH